MEIRGEKTSNLYFYEVNAPRNIEIRGDMLRRNDIYV